MIVAIIVGMIACGCEFQIGLGGSVYKFVLGRWM